MDIIVDALYWIATALILFSLATALGLLAVPAQLQSLARVLDRWHSLRPTLGPLDKPRHTERRIYRHHRLAGALIVAGAGYTLLRLSAIDHQATLALLPDHWDDVLRSLFAANSYWFLLVTNLAALGIGLVVYFRPSLLKHLETRSNHWLSTRQAMKPLDTYHTGLNVALWHRPRLTGAFLLLGSVYVWAVLIAYRHGIL